MATAVVSAVFLVVGKALAPLTDGLLKNWAASVDLGDNVEALERELKLVKALLAPTVGREMDNSALEGLLDELQELGYDADDVLDELDYFRIQDGLDSTFHAADEHAKGCAHTLALNARHTAKAVGKQINCFPSCWCFSASGADRQQAHSSNTTAIVPTAVSKFFSCCSSLPAVGDNNDNNDHDDSNLMMSNNPPDRNHADEARRKLTFDRVDSSRRMQRITEQLRRVREDVSNTVTALGYNWSTTIPQNIIAPSRPITTSESIEPKLYGRDLVMNSIIYDITEGKHCSSEALTVIPIVGPGGIGKTTLAQHIYHSEEVQRHFDVKVWTCVSLNFNVNRLLTEIAKYIPQADGDDDDERVGTRGELIGKRLENKRFLLVLDDVWDCSNGDEWEQLLLPFNKSRQHGNIIIVTTRFPAQAQIMVRKTDHSIHLQGLENKEFKELFLDFIFGDDQQSRKDHSFLLRIGDKIVDRLKGSPLAAKTVARLLRNQLDLVHWTRVLESREWEQSDGRDDIMPALKLSYDYLPSQLQQCFSYCALFPQDYKFEKEGLVNFWIGLDVLHSRPSENKRAEDIGWSHLTQLVNYGFLKKERKENGSDCYIVHDLLHELARKVSSDQCLSINSSQSQISSLQIPSSIRHLSINIDETSVEGRLAFKNCVEDFKSLDKILRVDKLRSLLLFGEYHGCLRKTFHNLFTEAKALRVIFLSQASYKVEKLLHNFYDLVHLRYLHIGSHQAYVGFPSKISRFYHVMVLDGKHCDYIDDLPRDISNLVKLRHFLVHDDATHSCIVEVGKLKSLQELRRFVVKKEDQGFELRQIGQLGELCGSLCIDKLENVQVKEEADEAKLLQKCRLQELILHWSSDPSRLGLESTLEEHVLEGLKPSSNLLKLSIKGHRGSTCPSWLGSNLIVRSLESLCLDGVPWKTFPPIGEMCLASAAHETISANIPVEKFENMRRLELVSLPKLKKWIVHDPCQLFPFLEALVIRDCSQLVELSFSHFACCQQEKENYAHLFPRLSELEITNCPQLMSFPPVPWTETPCSIRIYGIGHSCVDELRCKGGHKSEYSLTIEGKGTPDSTFWNVLAFHSLTKLKALQLQSCPPLPHHRLQMLSSLRKLMLSCLSNDFPFAEANSLVSYQFPVEMLIIHMWNASGKELTQLLTYFPKLSCLELSCCEQITGLGVLGQQAMTVPGPSSSSNNKEVEAQTEHHQQQDTRTKEEIVSSSSSSAAAAAEGILFLPPHLQKLKIYECLEMIGNKEDGQSSRGGLEGLSSLQQMDIVDCANLISSFPSCFHFPNSLTSLNISYCVISEEILMSLSNLSFLTSLSVATCGDLRSEGLWSLLAQGHLTKLNIRGTPNFFTDSEPSGVHEKALPPRSTKLQYLSIDNVSGFTATPIRGNLVLSSLTTLKICGDQVVECFTEEQEALLFVNSLEEIIFGCCKHLRYLPARLHRLPNLKRLWLLSCEAIQMQTTDGLSSSLQELYINKCPEIRTLHNCLPCSLQKLDIGWCSGIQSLPKLDDLPSSLRELDVLYSGSDKLKRHCRKLIGTIPIVIA